MDARFRMNTRYRSPEDRAEIARRVKIYTRQVEKHGRLYWLTKVKKLKNTEALHEAGQTELD